MSGCGEPTIRHESVIGWPSRDRPLSNGMTTRGALPGSPNGGTPKAGIRSRTDVPLTVTFDLTWFVPYGLRATQR
uniref:Uncharacterized protein n=1 Tax=Romanomermis culicivorax TaxID=13658 RepID=A0A915I7F1_ROMCU